VSRWENLLQPIQIGRLTVKNRLEAAPTDPGLAHADGSVSTELIDYHKAKAQGGVGIVTVGSTAVDAAHSIIHPGLLVIDHDRKVPGLARLADSIHRYGAVASLELVHAGKTLGVGDMTIETIEQVVEDFAAAAYRLQHAGFDMVLIHGGHGWLLAQFVSPLTNTRTDEYGGSLENRARFPLAVLARIRERCGEGFAIEYRLSGEELMPGGLEIDEAIGFAQLIQDRVDLFQVSAGTMREPRTTPYVHPAYFLPRGRNVRLAARFRAALSKPVTALGAIMDLDLAERAVAKGEADVVAMARALIADPALPIKTRGDRKEDIVPCIRCNECLARVARWLPLWCATNPMIGAETEYKNVPAPQQRRRVVVAGGGPAGMQAALTASSRGHDVVLFEKTDRLGGNLWVASRPDFKDEMKRFQEYLTKQVGKSNVDLRLGMEATTESVRAERPDALIVAVGAEPTQPAIEGLDRPNVVWAGDVFVDRVPAGERVVVAGGGGVGCEAALHLARQGKNVTVVELLPELALDYNFINRPLLLELLAEKSVETLVGATVVEITGQGATVVDADGRHREIAADMVVLALGMVPRLQTVDSLRAGCPDVRLVGDCLSPRTLIDAVREGFFAAIEL
jgi:2,4-dienoyl-CoA reductase-like NADH-dependent reductase (Old Yellow Enzyme family)/thioredoxin reductase